MAASGAGHRDGVEGRGLEHDARGPARHLGVLAAHDAREAEHAVSVAAGVGDQQVLGVEGAGDVVEGGELLALAGTAHGDGADELLGVVGVQRLAQVEHHVVGDVDDQGDRTHAGEGEAACHPARGLRGGVHALDLERDEAGAALGAVQRRLVPELDGHSPGLGRSDRDLGCGVGEGGAGGVAVLARHAPHREAVAAVGGHVDLDDLVREAEQRDSVVAGLGGQALRVAAAEHDDAVLAVGVRAQAQLLAGADHAVGGVAVGLPRGDREVAGQHGAREGDDHQIALDEVVRAADDAAARALLAGLRVLRVVGVLVVLGADVHADPVDGLAVLLRLLDELEHAADHERAGHLRAEQRFFLEADAGEVGGDLERGGGRGELDVLAEPGQGNARHLRSPSRSAGRSGRRPPPCPACPPRRCAA